MSFQQGLSGLNASSKNLEVIGNNIANANTFGSKVARAEFSDVYAAAIGVSNKLTVGIGTTLSAVAQQFTQGSITTTANPLDLAINGNGFFQLSDVNNQTTYSRNGQFKINRDGYIVNNNQSRLIGYPADALGVIQSGQAKNLQLTTGGISPAPSSKNGIEMNLDSRQAVTLPAAGPQVDFNDAKTYNNATSVTSYDDKGQEIAMTYYFQKSATDTWNVYATANGNSVAGDNVNPLPITTVNFASDGSAPLTPVGDVLIDIPATTSAAGVETMPILQLKFNVDGATQFGSPFGVTDIQQDGFSAGLLTDIAIEGNGTVMARYSNGKTRPVGQVELATFRNPQGLQPIGNNAWILTAASGTPVAGVPGNGFLGALQSGALEESNIDLTGELVGMITAQRIYQANAQTIKAQDQILQTLVNLR